MIKNKNLKVGQIESGNELGKKQTSLFIRAGISIKERRELNSITRADLSKTTRISVAVIESLENGWLDQLPETTYLIPMLKILENELGLDGEFSQELFYEQSKENNEDKSNPINTINNILLSNKGGGTFIFGIYFT